MNYKGNDLKIFLDGTAIAGSKSCVVNLTADTIEISSPSQGNYRHYLPDRLKWEVTANALIPCPSFLSEGTELTVTSDISYSKQIIGKNEETGTADDIYFTICQYDQGVKVLESFSDAYDNSRFIDFVRARITHDFAGRNDIIWLFSTSGSDPFPEDWRSIWVDYFGRGVPTNTTAPWLFIGTYTNNVFKYGESQITSTMYAVPNGDTFDLINPEDTHILQDLLLHVGKTYQLQVGLTGKASDSMTGEAICTKCQITGTRGNLLTGSFLFKGTGALE